MESVLVLIVAVGIPIMLIYISKINALAVEVAHLKAQVLAMGQAVKEEPAAAAAVSEPVILQPIARRKTRAAAPAIPSLVSEPAVALLDEAVPGFAVATAALESARADTPRGESAVGRLARRFRGTEEWEALVGGRLLHRLGAIALTLAIAFFLKYAIDQNWINQSARVLLGVVIGGGLLVLAARAHGRGYAIFAQGLVGAGLSALYLSVYASYNFYHLVPQPVALAGMGAVTAVALFHALSYDSLAVSLLACAGGYATPFLLSSSHTSPLGVILFLLLLDASVLAILARRSAWWVLEPIALGATWITFYAWYAGSYTSGRMVTAAVAAALFWGLFFLVDLAGARSTAPVRVRHVLGAFNGFAFYGALLATVGRDHHTTMSLLSLAIGLAYVGAVQAARRQKRLTADLAARYGLSAIAVLALAAAVRFSGFTLVILWSLEVLPLLWFGTRSKLTYVWRPALVIQALALCLLFATPGSLAMPAERFVLALNERALAYLILSGSLAAATIAFRRSP